MLVSVLSFYKLVLEFFCPLELKYLLNAALRKYTV